VRRFASLDRFCLIKGGIHGSTDVGVIGNRPVRSDNAPLAWPTIISNDDHCRGSSICNE
jgi:hypothetical protein